MSNIFTASRFSARFRTEDICLEEIKRMHFPKGVFCHRCRKTTKHYKLQNRTAYSCKYCRNHVYPLKGTIFEKTSTPLRLWFYAIFLMTQTGGKISTRQLQRELEVTYKTAWRIRTLIAQNNEDLLSGMNEQERVHKWLFFNKLEFKVAERQQTV